jgi:hypothetical protein
VRVKAGTATFAQGLAALGCSTETRDDVLLVQIPEGQSSRMLWQAAAEQKQQIRYLRSQRSTLEEVFLKALEQK